MTPDLPPACEPVAHGDEEYLRFDPFEGDRDTDVRLRKVRLVTTRKTQKCCDPNSGTVHDIPPGTRCRFESALVDGMWGRYYTCVPCLDKWFSVYLNGGPDPDAT